MVKYQKLEDELLQARLRAKDEVIEFMEGNVGVKWAALSNHILKTQTRSKYSHQVGLCRYSQY